MALRSDGLSYGISKDQALEMLWDLIKDDPPQSFLSMIKEVVIEPAHILDVLPDEEDLPAKCRTCSYYDFGNCANDCKIFKQYLKRNWENGKD